MWLRRPVPQAACVSYSSGRAVQTTSRGTPCAQSARCSRNASSAGSAQWTSSTTSTSGARSATDSRNLRHAVNELLVRRRLRPRRSRAGVAAVRATTAGRRIRAAPHPASRSRRSGGSDSKIPAWAFTISPSAQNVIPSPYGRQRPCRQVTSSVQPSAYANSSATRRRLADARLAGDRDELHRPFDDRLVECAAQQREVELAPDQRRRHRPDHVRAEAGRRPQRPPDRDRLGLSLGVDRIERLVLEHPLRRPERALARPRPRPPVPATGSAPRC